MARDEIQLDGDPRKLAMAIYRAARDTYREQHGSVKDTARFQSELEKQVPELAKQMVESLDRDTRDIYLMNALEVLAITYAKRELKRRG